MDITEKYQDLNDKYLDAQFFFFFWSWKTEMLVFFSELGDISQI